jgi:hypothetical protein
MYYDYSNSNSVFETKHIPSPAEGGEGTQRAELTGNVVIVTAKKELNTIR